MNVETVTARPSVAPPARSFLRRSGSGGSEATASTSATTERQAAETSVAGVSEETERASAPNPVKTAIDPILSADERVRLVCALARFRAPVEGRDAVSSKTAQLALALQDQTASLGAWLPPNVSRSPNGEVVFEWWHGARKLTVYVGEHAREFVRVWGPDIDSDMTDGTINGGGDLSSQLQWLTQGQ